MNKLIHLTTYDCPICDTVHKIEVWERDSSLLINNSPTAYKEIIFLCDRGVVDETNEFVPIWVMDFNILRARVAYKNGFYTETSNEQIEEIIRLIGEDVDVDEIRNFLECFKKSNL